MSERSCRLPPWRSHLCHLRCSRSRPWRPRAWSRVAWPPPWRDLVLGELGDSPTCRWSLPLAWSHRGRAGTTSPCHDGTSWVSSKFFLSSVLLGALLELALCSPGACSGYAPPLRCTGVPPQACSRAVELGWL
jgi:hypothetical protein